MFKNVLKHVADGLEFFNLAVRYIKAELCLQIDDEFHNGKRVSSDVRDK